MNKTELIDFARTEDYAYCRNAGIMFANDHEEREAIADMVAESNYIEEADVEDCPDLKEEVENGCTIYRVVGSETFYIAYYE